MKLASLDVDAQKGFTPLCPGELPVPEGQGIARELNRLAERTQLRLGSKDAHAPNALWVSTDPQQIGQPTPHPQADRYWPPHCIPGTPGFELLDALPSPREYDYFVWKGIEPDLHPYGACYHDRSETLSTGLIEYLHSQQVSQVILGGLALEFCVLSTALQLQRAGFETGILLSACRALSAEGEAGALQALQGLVHLYPNLQALDQALQQQRGSA